MRWLVLGGRLCYICAEFGALEVAAADDEAVSQQEKLIDIQQKNNLSVLVAYGHEIIMLLKCIVVLVCLVIVGIAYVVARLS